MNLVPAKPIVEATDGLPAKDVTVMALQALDFVVPGQWTNTIGFDNTIREVTGETNAAQIQAIRQRALQLYNDPSKGYQRALWIYQAIDKMDLALGTAALAHKAGEKIPFLSFLSQFTPKADTTQTIDLALKLVGEGVAFASLRGVPPTQINEFIGALKNYAGASILRLAALVAIDGLMPLGPNFVQGTQSALSRLNAGELENNDMFKRISAVIPGVGAGDKLGFITNTFNSAQGWIDNFITSRGLTRDKIAQHMGGFLSFADDSLDYVGAFLDVTTNYYEHTGVQTVARHLIEDAAR